MRRMLVGWVPIAKFLNVGESTARRWGARQDDPIPVENLNGINVAIWNDVLKDWQARQAAKKGRCKQRPAIQRDAA
jgi:hypothetical protein